ncbi:DUF6455 family protein [Rhabdaerophilum calidifontis]|uniref:DUF6455 family protein n=1 Tax=Rhabdaerophilum calidifontis TaxID=2604328 RepID=UPI00123906E3|nr:DUF6455 family protein [Rhabdaerophilum calidifontis]
MSRIALSALPQAPFQAIVEWFRRQARARELDALDAEELRHIAADLRVSIDDLRDTTCRSGAVIGLMRRMMALHGLDPGRIERESPELMRDMTLTCARCAQERRCAHGLAEGIEPSEAGAFCPNAGTMAALARAQHSECGP